MRAFCTVICIVCFVLFLSMNIGFPFDLRDTPPDSSLDENSGININGNNNRITVINGNDNQIEPSVETPIPDNSNDAKTDDSNEEKADDISTESNNEYASDTYIISAIAPDDIVEQNYDAIIQKKAEYTDSDTLLINSEFIYLSIYEQAGFVSFTKDDTPDVTSSMPLGGEFISSAIVIFLDYETDNIIYTLISNEDGDVEYFPTNKRKFYYIVASSEYELYISEPIQLSEEYSQPYAGTFVFLSKKYDTYSPQFQVKVNEYDTSKTVRNHTVLSNADITVYLVTRTTNDHVSYLSFHYPFDTNDSGIISFKGAPCYFQLNNRYVMDIKRLGSDPITIDALIKNTNVINIDISPQKW